jgi:hypothetical protein
MSLKDKIAAQRKALADNKAAFERSYRFKVGKTVCRLLPGVDDADTFSKPYGAHYIKDPRDPAGKTIIAVVGDAEICYGKIDPVRQAISEFISACNERGDETAAKYAKEWLAKPSNIVNLEIISGVDTENNGKVVPWEASSNQYDGVLSVMESVMDADPTFSMTNGLVFQVERVGTGMSDTKYTFSYFPGTATIAAPTSNVLSQRIPLDSYVSGKFGMNVTKALNHLSSLLGRDVTANAIASATAPAQIAAPLEVAEVEDAVFEPVSALDEMDEIPPFDVTPAADPVAAAMAALAAAQADAAAKAAAPVVAAAIVTAAPVAADAFENILADLENI